MLTTTTPGAQEFSIARSAASPPKDAPYPTEEGMATRGVPVSPPITDGRAPSSAYALYRVDVHVAWRGADAREHAIDLGTLATGAKPT